MAESMVESDSGESDSGDEGFGRALLHNFARWRRQGMAGRRKRSEDVDQPDQQHQYVRHYFWSCIHDSGFPNRVNHAVAAHRASNGDWFGFSFGGYHADDDERTVFEADSASGPFFKSTPIDVHCCDVETRTWARLYPPPCEKYYNVEPHQRTAVPGCRYGHTVCPYKGRIYMYGGRNDEDGSFSSVECYDIANNIWLKIRCDGERPTSRDGHACTSVGAEMIVNGGFAASEIKFSSETYSFNMDSHVWHKVPTSGDMIVPERDFHTATAVHRKLVVFGGRSDLFHPYFTANDVYDKQFYSYSFDTQMWAKEAITGYQPEGRRSHCAIRLGSNIIYFGGYNAIHKQHFGDLFVVNTDTWHVTEIRPFGDAPCPRRRVGCALVGSDLMICGGTSPIIVERDGRKKEILHDHNDVYILHLLPTLEQLAVMTIINENIDVCTLPSHMQEKIKKLRVKQVVTIKHPSSVENLKG